MLIKDQRYTYTNFMFVETFFICISYNCAFQVCVCLQAPIISISVAVLCALPGLKVCLDLFDLTCPNDIQMSVCFVFGFQK